MLCIAGLTGSWGHALVHDHSTEHSTDRSARASADTDRSNRVSAASADDSRVSSDDSHHEHSARKALEVEACLVCRSDSPDDADRLPAARLAIDSPAAGRALTARTESWQRFARRVHSPRAPPAQHAPIG